MIDARQAIYIARRKAAEVLQTALSVEEIERESYKDRDVWSITDPFQYKRFLIDVETEELLAVKMREVASQ